MDSPFRIYEADECGSDGYPLVWHKNDGSLDELLIDLVAGGYGEGLVGSGNPTPGIKHIVRAQARHRCLRCLHPFLVGKSGEMAGNEARAKALAASVGADVEMLDFGFEDLISDGKLELPIDRIPRTNWSDCDLKCRHGGPARYLKDDGAWTPEEDPGSDALNMLVHTRQVQAAWRILTVHHLTEEKADLRWWNLVALCQRCHLLIQRKVTMTDPWPWEHTDWFRPYAAAWYALRYLDQDLDRDETMSRMDMLLELGRREESVERMPI